MKAKEDRNQGEKKRHVPEGAGEEGRGRERGWDGVEKGRDTGQSEDVGCDSHRRKQIRRRHGHKIAKSKKVSQQVEEWIQPEPRRRGPHRVPKSR